MSILLPRDEKSSDPKCWIQGNTKIGPVLEVTTSYQQGKHGVEIRIEPWIDIEPGAQFDQAHPVAKRLNTLLRQGELLREEDGEIEFWKLKDDLQNKFEYSQHCSAEMRKSIMTRGGGNKIIFQYCTDSSGNNVHLRALQCHSGHNPFGLSLQDNVLIPDNFFENIYHDGCAVKLHSQIQD